MGTNNENDSQEKVKTNESVKTKQDVIALLNTISNRKDDKIIKQKKKNINKQRKKKTQKKQQQNVNNKKKKEPRDARLEQRRETLDKHSYEKKKDLSDVLVDINPKRCYFKGCRKKVHLIRLQCNFCAQIFCMKHGAPIFHSDACAKLQKIK